MATDKRPCPTCGRTIGLLATGAVRRHNNPDTGVLCAGGTPAESNVVQIGARNRHKAADMSPADLEAANKGRPPSKGLNRAGNGACGARLSTSRGRVTEDRCTQAKGWQTDHVGFGHCRKHGGASPTGKKHAALERARAELARRKAEATFYGRRVAVDPEQALLEEMQRSVGVVRWLEEALSEWGRFEALTAEMDELEAELDPAGVAEKILGSEQASITVHVGPHGAAAEHAPSVTFSDPLTGLPTLVGVHSTEKALGFTDTEYRAWTKVYQEERRHLAAVAKACIDANIAERRQAVLEARGDMIRALVGIAFRIAGVQLDEARRLAITAEATRLVVKELPA